MYLCSMLAKNVKAIKGNTPPSQWVSHSLLPLDYSWFWRMMQQIIQYIDTDVTVVKKQPSKCRNVY